MPNFSSLAGLEVAEKFLWGGVGGGVVCTVIFVSNQPVVLCCVGVGVLTIMVLRNIFSAPGLLNEKGANNHKVQWTMIKSYTNEI